MKIRCSIFPNLRQPKPAKLEELTWDNYVDKFISGDWLKTAQSKGVSYPTKDRLPLYGMFLLKSGQARANDNIVEVYAISLDFDSGCNVEDLESVFGSYLSAIHTTWSHTSNEPRTRVVLPLKRPVTKSEYALIIRWAMEFSETNGLIPDPACKDPARAWFVPCTREQSLYEYVYNYVGEADPLDPDSVLSGNEGEEENLEEDDVKVDTYNGPIYIKEWGKRAQLGDKIRTSCPEMDNSTIGSAFIRRCKFGVRLCCTSQNHGHKTPLVKYYPFEKAENPREVAGGPEDSVLPYLTMKMSKGEMTDKPVPTSSNLQYILEHDSRWKSRVWLNSFSNHVWFSPPGCDDRPWKDEDDTELSIWLTRVYGTVFSTKIVRETVNLHASRHCRNPLQEAIDSVEWDGKDRLEEWLSCGFGVSDTPINRAISRRWAVQAIARCFKPGCQADATLVLVGGQGVGKSSGLRILGGEYFSDTPLDMTKESFMQIARTWIYEIAELDSFRGRANSQIKAFLTATHDTFRAPYKSRAEELARHVVFAATTNERSILSDSTGARRFWVVQCTSVDREYLEQNRSQVWAEALVAFRKRHPRADGQWWLNDTEESMLREMQMHYQVTDSWSQLIEEYIETKKSGWYTTTEIMSGPLQILPHLMNQTKQKRVAETLRRLGFTKKRVTNEKGRRIMAWYRPRIDEDAHKMVG